MKNSWSDERLDDLNHHVEEGFRRVDGDLRELRGEVASLRGEMNARFDALQRVLLQFGGVLVAALVGMIATLIATQV